MSLQKFNNKLSIKKKVELKLWHKLLFLSPIFIIVLLFKGNEWYRNYMLSNYGKETIAKITFVSLTGVHDQFEINNVAFNFKYFDSVITGFTIAETNDNYVLLPNEMPLLVDDEYIVKYVEDNPDINEVNFLKPTVNTLINYIKITSDTLIKLKYFENSILQKNRCFNLAKLIYFKFGTNGLATIIFWNESVAENFKHNSITFRKFISNKEFKEMIEKCK